MTRTQRDSLLSRGLALLEELDPVTVTISGTDYAASGGPVTRESVIEDGGEIQVRRRIVQIRQSTLATRPTEGTLATIATETWRILAVTADSRSLMWKLHLEGHTARP